MIAFMPFGPSVPRTARASLDTPRPKRHPGLVVVQHHLGHRFSPFSLVASYFLGVTDNYANRRLL